MATTEKKEKLEKLEKLEGIMLLLFAVVRLHSMLIFHVAQVKSADMV